jgi:hypothetical protein
VHQAGYLHELMHGQQNKIDKGCRLCVTPSKTSGIKFRVICVIAIRDEFWHRFYIAVFLILSSLRASTEGRHVSCLLASLRAVWNTRYIFADRQPLTSHFAILRVKECHTIPRSVLNNRRLLWSLRSGRRFLTFGMPETSFAFGFFLL